MATLLCLWLLRGHLPQIDTAAIMALFHALEPHRWAIAALCTAASLTAVGFYDVTVARLMQLPVSDRAAFAAGWRATAIAQSLGFGVITGALVRWRLLGLHGKDGLWVATKMTGLVTASYFYGWVVIAGLCAVIAPGLPPQIWWLGVLALWVGFSLAVISLRGGSYGAHSHPPIAALGRVIGLTFIDTLAACAVIYCFLPEGYAPFLMLYASFLIAYSLGMISGVPGGVGPFEMCLLALLAPLNPEPLLAAILGYRAVYFLAPALIAAVSLVSRRRPAPLADACLARQAQDWPAEAALTSQGSLSRITASGGGGLACQTCNSEAYLRDPVGPNVSRFLQVRRDAARKSSRRLVLYKCSARVAQMGRGLGLLTLPIASEAVLRAQDFSTDGKACATLRRKLRKAAKAGVTCQPGAPRLSEMHDIDRAWQVRCGPARGFSVGQFCPDIVRAQASFTAYRDGQSIAFIPCHTSRDRWVLDLMRSDDGCPDGTMQALVVGAISNARDAGVAEFSLCSVPFHVPKAQIGWIAWGLGHVFDHSKSAQGLLRFKSGFDPVWRTEYLAADGVLGLVLGGFELSRLIAAPRPLPHPAHANSAHEDYDSYEFASISQK